MVSLARYLIHTATITKPTSLSRGTAGEIVTSGEEVIYSGMARLLTRSEREAIPAQSAVVSQGLRLLLPPGAAVDQSLTVSAVTLEDQTVVGPFSILEVITRRKRKRAHHLSLSIERIEAQEGS